MAIDRVRIADMNDFVYSKIINGALNEKYETTKVFHFAEVINNVDPLNSNRIQLRIPIIDDVFYLNKNKGNDFLPWCSPISRNFLEVPENNTIVLVAFFDTKNPYFGRIYFDSITSLSHTNIFDKSLLIPEENTYNNWDNAAIHQNIKIISNPKNTYNVKNNIKYDIGIKGKGNNKIILNKNSTSIYQNEGLKTQSLLELTDNIVLHAAKNINIVSDEGTKNLYHPVFDQPLYKYLNEINSVLKAIITTLGTSSTISTNPSQPSLPSPSSLSLINNLTDLILKYNDFITPANGASNKISIN